MRTYEIKLQDALDKLSKNGTSTKPTKMPPFKNNSEARTGGGTITNKNKDDDRGESTPIGTRSLTSKIGKLIRSKVD